MNIDERLEALTARHEALAQTVEIIAGMQRENEKYIAETAQQIRALVRVAELHHERLSRLEDQH
jgi:hypothetical protein